MSLQTRLSDFITAVGTDYKQLRTWISGSASGDLTGLTTTAKTSLVAAINEVQSEVGGAAAPDASETVKGLVELATLAEVATGTDTLRAVTPAGVRQERDAIVASLIDSAPGTLDTLNELAAALGDDPNFAGSVTTALSNKQPIDSDLTAIAALTTTAYGRAFLELADQTALMALVQAASETVAGKIEIATQAEITTGTDDVRAVTPLKLQTRLAAGFQPLDSDLTAIAALTTTTYGRAFLSLADQAALVALLPSYQPLDSDLTSIAALSTTVYGRGFLALADQAALMGLIAAASETVAGKIEIATQAEVTTGTDDVRAVTPLKLVTHLGNVETDLVALYSTAKA